MRHPAKLAATQLFATAALLLAALPGQATAQSTTAQSTTAQSTTAEPTAAAYTAAATRLNEILAGETPANITDCTMQAGDSGGPLFDMQGRVVGINSRISRNLAMNMHAPIDALVAQWTELQEGKVTQAGRRGRRARLGFGATLRYGEGCPVFGDVPKDSAAAKAGLKAGDRLFEVDGIEIDTRRSVMRILRELRAGDEVEVVVERAGKGIELTLPVVAGEAR